MAAAAAVFWILNVASYKYDFILKFKIPNSAAAAPELIFFDSYQYALIPNNLKYTFGRDCGGLFNFASYH